MAAEMGNRIGRRFGEQQSVECAVENVAHRSGENQRQPDDYPCRRFFALAEQPADQPCDASRQYDAENAQQQFAPVEAAARRYVHAERRPVVFDKAELEPVGEDDNRFVEVHVGLDPYLEGLVGYKQRNYKQGYFFDSHCFWFSYAQR